MSEGPEDQKPAGDNLESLLPIDEHIEEGRDAEGRKVRHRGIYLPIWRDSSKLHDVYTEAH